MLRYIKRLWTKILDPSNDPVHNCDVYTDLGCSHVDGYLCDMKTCGILKKHKISVMTPQQKVDFVRKLDEKLAAIDKTNK